MKQALFFAISLLLFNCHSKTEGEKMESEYPRKDRFIVSENNRWLDSIQNAPVEEGFVKIEIANRGILRTYAIGKYHFLILNPNEVYYVSQAKTYLDVLMCGNIDETDSIREMNIVNAYLDSIQSIQLDSIQDYLRKNKNEIIAGKENRRFPVPISFALKNDTLQGPFMHDILKFMEENGMKSYFIRRMNDKELKAVEELK